MEEHYRLLELAAGGQVPERVDEHSTPGFNILRELVEAGYLTAIDVSSHSAGHAYLNPRITLAGREFLQKQMASSVRPSDSTQSSIRIFISHSSQDHELVRLLLDLLRSALRLPSGQVRCTSIDGYRLPGGANTHEQLRAEVHDADAFIGVISAHSIKSLYVAFELGARWGAGKPLIPLLAPGVDVSLLGGPLAGLNALRSDSRAQLQQLVGDIAQLLHLSPEPPQVYENAVEAILRLGT
jgi:hypothetical protein